MKREFVTEHVPEQVDMKNLAWLLLQGFLQQKTDCNESVSKSVDAKRTA